MLLFRLLFFGGVCPVSFLAGCGAADRDVWRALVLALPSRISPSEMSISGYYIIKQTHEPVFRKDDGYNYSSRILKKWSRSIDYRTYTFCPDTSLTFDTKRIFSFEIFKDHIADVTQKFNGDFVMTREGECLRMEFSAPAIRYLDFLSGYPVSPSIRVSTMVEAGLGPFMVVSLDGSEVVMRRKHKVRDGFNEIRVIDYKWAPPAVHEPAWISDYNFALGPKELEGLGPEYISFGSMSLKSYVLLINLRDSELRRVIYNCVDIDALRKAFMPDATDFSYTKTVLPVGVPGGYPGRPAQECRIDRTAASKYPPVVFTNWRNDNVSRLELFAADMREKTGLRVKIVNYSAAEMGRRFHDKPKPYGLVIIATAPDSDENYRMLASYFGKNNLLDFAVPGVAELYAELTKEDDPERQKRLVENIAERLAKNHFLLPLYQTGRRVYYPKTIKNMSVGKELFEYPEIAGYRF
jgi:hypothetical protein